MATLGWASISQMCLLCQDQSWTRKPSIRATSVYGRTWCLCFGRLSNGISQSQCGPTDSVSYHGDRFQGAWSMPSPRLWSIRPFAWPECVSEHVAGNQKKLGSSRLAQHLVLIAWSSARDSGSMRFKRWLQRALTLMKPKNHGQQRKVGRWILSTSEGVMSAWLESFMLVANGGPVWALNKSANRLSDHGNLRRRRCRSLSTTPLALGFGYAGPASSMSQALQDNMEAADQPYEDVLTW